MAAQFELLKELLNSGTKLNFGQEFFFKFYQAFLLKDRWLQYVGGVGTTLLVTALAIPAPRAQAQNTSDLTLKGRTFNDKGAVVDYATVSVS